MNLDSRFMWILSSIRLEWLGAHFTSFDMLEFTVSTTRVLVQSGDRHMLAECMRDLLIPNLEQVLEWAQEVVDENS